MARRKKTDATVDEADAPVKEVKRWLEEIESAKKRFKDYYKRADKIVKRYKDADKSETTKRRRYNALWSVIQTMQPLVYLDPPTPYVSRRHNDKDPAARDASLILQRSLANALEGDELDDALTEARDDYLLASRGVVWCRYSPYFDLKESSEKTYLGDEEEAPDGIEVKKDEKGKYTDTHREKAYEECVAEHVFYADFLHGAAAKWRDVPWVARRVLMTRSQQIERFGEKMGKLAPLTVHSKEDDKTTEEKTDDAKGLFAKSEIYEIWDRTTRCIKWLCPDVKDTFLDKQEDILGLQNFFPCPQPAFGTKTNDSLIPTPDYAMWQDIAIELDDITHRIKLLTKALRVVGVYDKSLGDTIKRIVTHTDDNDLIPIDNWALFAERGGLKSSVDYMQIDQIATVLKDLLARRQTLIQELYDITGVADIQRGSSDPRETAAAQKIKGNFASQRLKARQKAMGRMARETLEIFAQIICSQYSDEMIMQTSSAQQILTDQNGQFDMARWVAALQLLRTTPMRRFRIKIDERKLASAGIEEDREEITGFIQAVSSYMQVALPMLQSAPGTARLLGEILMLGVRTFPQARSVEARLEEAMEALIAGPPAQQEQKEGAAGQAPTSPEEIAIQQKLADIKLQELGVKRQELILEERRLKSDHEFRMAQIAQKEKAHQDDLAHKQRKEQTDAMIKAKQVDNQADQAQQAHALNERGQEQDAIANHNQLVTAFAERKEKAKAAA